MEKVSYTLWIEPKYRTVAKEICLRLGIKENELFAKMVKEQRDKMKGEIHARI